MMWKGGAKAQEASFVFDELVDKYGASAALLNGLAISKMQQGNFEEAETHLLEALTKVWIFLIDITFPYQESFIHSFRHLWMRILLQI